MQFQTIIQALLILSAQVASIPPSANLFLPLGHQTAIEASMNPVTRELEGMAAAASHFVKGWFNDRLFGKVENRVEDMLQKHYSTLRIRAKGLYRGHPAYLTNVDEVIVRIYEAAPTYRQALLEYEILEKLKRTRGESVRMPGFYYIPQQAFPASTDTLLSIMNAVEVPDHGPNDLLSVLRFQSIFYQYASIEKMASDAITQFHKLGYAHGSITLTNLLVLEDKVHLVDFQKAVKLDSLNRQEQMRLVNVDVNALQIQMVPMLKEVVSNKLAALNAREVADPSTINEFDASLISVLQDLMENADSHIFELAATAAELAKPAETASVKVAVASS
jgi:hypothetical protein